VQARWGTAAHITFFVFCILTNIIVTSMLILGAAASVEALTGERPTLACALLPGPKNGVIAAPQPTSTSAYPAPPPFLHAGMNLYAAAILIPVGVMFYTAHGGLRASYLASWANTGTIFIALNIVSAHTLLLLGPAPTCAGLSRELLLMQPPCWDGPRARAGPGITSRRLRQRTGRGAAAARRALLSPLLLLLLLALQASPAAEPLPPRPPRPQFAFMVYASGMWPIGSISRVYENLGVIAGPYPVEGNKDGSYMTIWSMNGLIFGIINVSSWRAAGGATCMPHGKLGARHACRMGSWVRNMHAAWAAGCAARGSMGSWGHGMHASLRTCGSAAAAHRPRLLTHSPRPGACVVQVIGNFGTVFVDQSYWQGAIGALPTATYRGYLIGGLCWFSVPFTMATAM
jgi:hypothetical protein